ncbi:MAG: hypothetical protein HQ569_02100 [Actinobacteria bacterium]|nr:hypothetical protein [Actinomycetota bacterium]
MKKGKEDITENKIRDKHKNEINYINNQKNISIKEKQNIILDYKKRIITKEDGRYLIYYNF